MTDHKLKAVVRDVGAELGILTKYAPSKLSEIFDHYAGAYDLSNKQKIVLIALLTKRYAVNTLKALLYFHKKYPKIKL